MCLESSYMYVGTYVYRNTDLLWLVVAVFTQKGKIKELLEFHY